MIPLHPLSVQLELLTGKSSRDHQELDITLYCRTRRAGGPIPLFRRTSGQGERKATGIQRWLSVESQLAIQRSELSDEELARSMNVDLLIIRDIKRPPSG